MQGGMTKMAYTRIILETESIFYHTNYDTRVTEKKFNSII